MTKVKIFVDIDVTRLETQINEFIKDKKVIDIKYNTITFVNQYSERGIPTSIILGDRALIIYEEDE